MKIKWVLLFVLIWLSLGCASIIKGGDQPVTFQSTPAGASLKVYDVRNANTLLVNDKTPYTVTLKRGAGYFRKAIYKAVFEMEGFNSTELVVEGRPGGWYIGGNLVFGGLIGWFVLDPITGAMWTLEPEKASVNLTPVGSTPPPAPGAAPGATPPPTGTDGVTPQTPPQPTSHLLPSINGDSELTFVTARYQDFPPEIQRRLVPVPKTSR